MSVFGWSLPPGCTLNDIDELCGEHGPSCFCEDCLGDPPEESETSMNFEPIWTPTTYERIPYAPHNSTMHDDRCSCPWCLPSEPDGLSEEEVAQMADESEETAEWEGEWEQLNDVRDAMESFNEVPSYFERFQQEKLNREALAQVQ